MTDRSPSTAPFTDYGGPGVPVVALHGHFGSARTFAGLARELGDAVRLIAPDQRGHGHAGSRPTYTTDDYVADAAAFVEARELAPAIVLGHSMGGVVAYALAARRPELVRAVIVEDAPAVVGPGMLDVSGWPRRAATVRELCELIEAQGVPDASYFAESAVRFPDGWGLAFDHDELMTSQREHVADYWADWLAVTVPVLLLHGARSFVVETAHVREMVERRPQTTYRELADAGHWIHDDEIPGVAAAIAAFVAGLDGADTTTTTEGSRA